MLSQWKPNTLSINCIRTSKGNIMSANKGPALAPRKRIDSSGCIRERQQMRFNNSRKTTVALRLRGSMSVWGLDGIKGVSPDPFIVGNCCEWIGVRDSR